MVEVLCYFLLSFAAMIECMQLLTCMCAFNPFKFIEPHFLLAYIQFYFIYHLFAALFVLVVLGRRTASLQCSALQAMGATMYSEALLCV